MAKMKILFDPVGNTMSIWWGDPADVVASEETDDKNKNDVLLKDKKGNVIGVEIIGLLPSEVNLSDYRLMEGFGGLGQKSLLLRDKDETSYQVKKKKSK